MDIKEAAHIDAAEHSDSVADYGATVRRRIIVAGLSGTALSLVPFLARSAGASGKNVAATSSSSSGTFTANSTDSLNNSPSGASTGGAGSSNSDAGATVNSGGGYNGTGDSTNTSSAVTIRATGSSTADTAAATTTTAPPKRPTADDKALLGFAQSIELTIRNLYDVAIDLGSFDGPSLNAVKAIREAHGAYAQSISGLLGRVAPNAPIVALFNALKRDFSGSPDEVAAAARALENTAVATHIDIVGQLIGIDGSALIGSMLVVEARHATVLATIGGVAELSKQLASTGKALSPSDYSTK